MGMSKELLRDISEQEQIASALRDDIQKLSDEKLQEMYISAASAAVILSGIQDILPMRIVIMASIDEMIRRNIEKESSKNEEKS